MTVIRKTANGSSLALVKGAPDVLLERCTHLLTADGERAMTTTDRERILAAGAEMAARALRVLGAAQRGVENNRPQPDSPEQVERDLVFVGLCGMQDPPRPEAKVAITKCRIAGIRVVMITGDHPVTARAIADELGLSDATSLVLTGRDLDWRDGLGNRGSAILIGHCTEIRNREIALSKVRHLNAGNNRRRCIGGG